MLPDYSFHEFEPSQTSLNACYVLIYNNQNNSRLVLTLYSHVSHIRDDVTDVQVGTYNFNVIFFYK